MKSVLEAEIRLIFDLRVARLFNLPEVVHSSSSFQVVFANSALFSDLRRGVFGHLVEVVRVLNTTEKNSEVDKVLSGREDVRVSLSSLDFSEQLSVIFELIDSLTKARGSVLKVRSLVVGELLHVKAPALDK